MTQTTAFHEKPGRACPTCQAVLPAEAQFCGGCGYRFVDLKATMVSEKRPAEPAAQPAVSSLELPVTMGAYRLESVIGAGGMGCVYRAVDTGLERVVAIKTLSTELAGSQEARARFEREARTVAALAHPNITGIYFLDARGQLPYYAMEFVEGESLEDRLQRQGRLPVVDACRVVVQAAGALSAAAAAGVVHRDIKPSNILLRASDGLVKLTDFGLAKPQAGKSMTSADVIVGTPLYMSPEQAMGKPLDFRSDLYSLGVTFYHCLAGQPPYDDDSAMGVLLKHLNAPLPPLAPLAPEAPPELIGIVEKMLAKDPAGRYASYEELARDLTAVGGGAFRRSRATSSSGVKAALRKPDSSAARPAAVVSRTAPVAAPPVAAAPTAVESTAFFPRCWRILSRPGDLASLVSQADAGTAFNHYFCVVLIGFVTSFGLHGPIQAFVGFSLITATLGLGVFTVLLFRRAGGVRDAFVIACYAATPLMVGGFRLMPLKLLFMLILMTSGALRFKRE